MKTDILKDYYTKRGFSAAAARRAVAVLEDCQHFLGPGNGGIEKCSPARINAFILQIGESKSLDSDEMFALAWAARLADNSELYIYLIQIAERGSIISNIRKHIGSVLGEAKTEHLFGNLQVPGASAPPEQAWRFTKQLVQRLEAAESPETVRKALQGNAHGIPAGAFSREAELYRQAADLESYLDDAHRRAVENLKEHAVSGKPWFEQIITPAVVDFVAANKEILGGVSDGRRIYWTKIPYNPDAWLREKDPLKQRYLSCHCPMAREILNGSADKMPGSWCNCTAGFIKQRFNAIFGRETDVELLESVLNGDDRCRFAVL